MKLTAVTLATIGLAAAQTSTFNGFCNAAAIARGDCSLTAAIVPSATTSTFNGFCNAAAIARGDCSLTAAIVPSPATSSYNGMPAASVPTVYTTYCPYATSFTYGASTYQVSSATTLTITCPGGCNIPVTPPATPAASSPATLAASSRAVYTGAAGPAITAGAQIMAAAGLIAVALV